MTARTWTPKRIALRNIVDAMRADMANGVDYMFEHPVTHEPLTDKKAEQVEKQMHKILDVLADRLPVWARP